MDPYVGIEDGSAPSMSSPAAPDSTLIPVSAQPSQPAVTTPPPVLRPGGLDSQVPWPLLVRLGFVAVVLIVAVMLIALGYTVAAAVGLVLGVGLAAVEIIKRLS